MIVHCVSVYGNDDLGLTILLSWAHLCCMCIVSDRICVCVRRKQILGMLKGMNGWRDVTVVVLVVT